jgi:hypothetical protein
MITAAATYVFEATRRGLEVTLSVPRYTIRARENEGSVPLLRELALLESSPEPVVQRLDRDSVVFSIATPDGAHAIVDRTLAHERDAGVGA